MGLTLKRVYLKFLLVAVLASAVLMLTAIMNIKGLLSKGKIISSNYHRTSPPSNYLNRRFCFSTLEVFRLNFLGIVSAPFHTPRRVINRMLDIISSVLLLGFIQRRNLNIKSISKHVLQTIFFYVVCHLLLALVTNHLIKSRVLIVSHLLHDCSSGLQYLNMPIFGLVLYTSKSSQAFRAVASVYITLQVVNVYMEYENFFSSVGLLIFSTVSAKRCFEELSHPKTFGRNSMLIAGTILVTAFAREMSKTSSPMVTVTTPKIAIGILYKAREDNQRYLSITLESFLTQLPHSVVDKNVKLSVLSFTHWNESNVVFDATLKLMHANKIANEYVDFVNGSQAIEDFIENKLNYSAKRLLEMRDKPLKGNPLYLHVATTLQHLSTKAPWADWIMIHEDDFSLCENRWNWFTTGLNAISNSDTPNCGFFVATGGAGLVIRKEVVPSLIAALLDKEVDLESDQVMQHCLRGMLKKHCNLCKQGESLFVSSHLIFRHIGFISSLGHAYLEKEARWACGAVHPFNGNPEVKVLHTDVTSFNI